MSHFNYLWDLAQDTPEPDRELENEAVGKFDGIIGIEPTHPEDDDYWCGYCMGLRQKYQKENND